MSSHIQGFCNMKITDMASRKYPSGGVPPHKPQDRNFTCHKIHIKSAVKISQHVLKAGILTLAITLRRNIFCWHLHLSQFHLNIISISSSINTKKELFFCCRDHQIFKIRVHYILNCADETATGGTDFSLPGTLWHDKLHYLEFSLLCTYWDMGVLILKGMLERCTSVHL